MKEMNCKTVHKDLIFYLEGNVDETVKTDIENHLSTCKNCSDFALMLKETLNVIEREKSIEAGSVFTEEVIARSAALTAKQFSIFDALKYVAAAAVIVLGVITGISIARYSLSGGIPEEAAASADMDYLNEMYQEPIESFFLLNPTENE